MSRPRKALTRFFSCRTRAVLRRVRDAGEDGFTLIELVITLVILPLVIGAIAVALLVTFQDQVGVSTRISTSVDAQVTSAYFVRDVQSATYITTSTTPASGSAAWPSTTHGLVTVCGSGTATSLLLSLAWPSGQQPIYDAVTVVSYWEMPNRVLERALCKGSTAPSVSLTARDFLSPFAHVLLSCAGSDACGRASSEWVPAQWVSGVTLAASEPLTTGEPLAAHDALTNRKYDYSLTATPRVSNTEGAFANPGGPKPHNPPIPPILALGSGPKVVKESSTASVTVSTGPAVLNTGYFQMTNNTSFKAPHIEVMRTACSKASFHTAKCTGTICATTKKPTSVCDPPKSPGAVWTHLTTAVPDPFSGLRDPTPVKAEFPIITTCQPHTGALRPGEYDCGGAPLTLGGGVSVTLAHGIYIFDTGLKVNGGSSLIGDTVLLYLPCKSSTTDGWVPSGTLAANCSEGFEVSGGKVTVSPLGTAPYSNLWFWQNVGDSTTASVHGAGTISVKTGILYMPGAEFKLSGLATQTTTVGSIIAEQFDVLNSHVKVKGFE